MRKFRERPRKVEIRRIGARGRRNTNQRNLRSGRKRRSEAFGTTHGVCDEFEYPLDSRKLILSSIVSASTVALFKKFWTKNHVVFSNLRESFASLRRLSKLHKPKSTALYSSLMLRH